MMMLVRVLQAIALFNLASAHYIFETLYAGNTVAKAAVRRPKDNSPISNITSLDMRCNFDLYKATETVTVAAGSRVGFMLDGDKTVYHMGPASMWLGKAPGRAADWDGSGKAWFKIAHWGAAFIPKFTFVSLNQREFYTTIPKSVSSGEYLLRMEHIGLHLVGKPESFMSCAQIKITNGGKGRPPMVTIPGHISMDEPGLSLDIYWPVPTAYTVPGPKPYRGQPDTCNLATGAKKRRLP
ncbi:glycosyl hydrolase family 61-domain-containing protein [Coprinopsis sp. MPI-PUGE-AT-0042]|nr:glycosyl hydrolase family 61-domain-containing protein [Coprinopsis sp. MPI-PUGE-AT-0042]